MVDPGFSRGSANSRDIANPRRDANLLFGHFFAEDYMKLKQIGLGGVASPAFLLYPDPPLTRPIYQAKAVVKQKYQRTNKSANKMAHSGFETRRKRHQKSKTGISVASQMDMCPTKILKIRSKKNDTHQRKCLLSVNGP